MKYDITGMSCAACSSRVEKAVSKVPGVESCSVSLLTNSMGVEGTASPEAVIAAVEAAGYGASCKGRGAGTSGGSGNGASGGGAEADLLEDTETPVLKKRLIWSIIFLVVLMYFSMGHMMWGWPVPEAMADNHVAMGLLQLLLTAAVMVINQKFFISGFRSLWHRAPNMDSLIAVGSLAALIYGVAALFRMAAAMGNGDMETVHKYGENLYFESASMILTLITLGKFLETRAKGKTGDAIRALMDLSPKTATVRRDGVETEVAVEDVRLGDTVIVRSG